VPGQALTTSALQIAIQVALRLALRASIVERRRPALLGAEIFEPSMGHGRVLALEDVVQEDAFAGILSHGKTK